MRRVSNFDGLKGIDSLRYLHIDGTVDWNQPIDNFDFLKGLPNIEVFSLGFITSKIGFPALLPLLDLKKLIKIRIGRAAFVTSEYAFMEVALTEIEGCSWELCWEYSDSIDFLGRGAGFVKKNSSSVKTRCEDFIALYSKIKKEAEEIVTNYRAR